MFTFKHPKYYKELRARNKSDQAISKDASTEATSVRPDPGLKRQAASVKLQAASNKRQAPSRQRWLMQASSPERQASSFKPQATSSCILFPLYRYTSSFSKSFEPRRERRETRIKVFSGCLIWKAI